MSKENQKQADLADIYMYLLPFQDDMALKAQFAGCSVRKVETAKRFAVLVSITDKFMHSKTSGVAD